MINTKFDHDEGNRIFNWIKEQENYTDYICGKLIPKNIIVPGNKLIIKYTPAFSDFVIGYAFRIPWNDGTIDIQINEHLAWILRLGTNGEKLFNIALDNCWRDYICDSMDEFMEKIGAPQDNIKPLGEKVRVITNKDKRDGAFCLCSDWVLDQACWRVCNNQDDMMIIPSSKHELLALPASGIDITYVKRYVYIVNREVVKKDALTDHIYLWHHAEHGNKGHLEEL